MGCLQADAYLVLPAPTMLQNENAMHTSNYAWVWGSHKNLQNGKPQEHNLLRPAQGRGTEGAALVQEAAKQAACVCLAVSLLDIISMGVARVASYHYSFVTGLAAAEVSWRTRSITSSDSPCANR